MIAALVLLFIAGYILMAAEHPLKINKSASALVTGTVCWTLYIVGIETTAESGLHQLAEHVSDIAGILFFLLAAMTIVELIDVHDGFDVITTTIKTRNKVKLLWILGGLTFFLSAVLDNLTTTIVMIALLRKLISDQNERWRFAGIVIIAANSGGAWSPIGDVTTTMLWIGGQITASNIIKELFFPSLVSLAVPLLILSFLMKGNFDPLTITTAKNKPAFLFEQRLILLTGIAALLFVPVFKSITHLPPFMGILLALGIVWITTELVHRKKNQEEKETYSVARALQRVDTPSILFFLGILLAVAALQTAGLLSQTAIWLQNTIGDVNIIMMSIGALSAIIDNVPLVAACIGMYDLSVYTVDHYMWEFLAYCAGTGGSILIIGSAAGVTCMGMEKITFGWYLKKISWLAAAGYLAGAFLYIIVES